MVDDKKEEQVEEEEDEVHDEAITNAWSKKVPVFKKGDMPNALLEKSSFSILFPKYRESYIKTAWNIISKTMKDYGINPDVDYIKGKLTVSTTNDTWDPYIIFKAKGFIELISRSVPVEQALRVLKDDITYEIVKIKSFVRNKERFIKRRQRLIGSNGATLKALELLTDCYVLIQGSTVAVIGSYGGVANAVEVIIETMENTHPVYLLKSLMIKRQLAKDDKLKEEDWARYLPKYTSRSRPKKTIKSKKKKKEYTPFPPPQQEKIVDKMLADGSYFLNKNVHKQMQVSKKMEEASKTSQQRSREKLLKAYTPPEEVVFRQPKPSASSDVNVDNLKNKLKNKKKL